MAYKTAEHNGNKKYYTFANSFENKTRNRFLYALSSTGTVGHYVYVQ